MQRRYENKVVLVTGAARGQGRAEAVRFAQEGASIIAVDICAGFATTKYPPAQPQDLEETARLVEEAGSRVSPQIADIRDYEALEAAVAKGVTELGGLNVVIANAGIVSYGRTWELTEEEFRDVIDVNLIGTWHTMKATVPHLLNAGAGSVFIVTNSVGGMRGMPFLGHYVASKHALVGLVKTLANELSQDKIRVLNVHPAGVDSPMNNVTGGGFREYMEKYPHLGALFGATWSPELTTPEQMAGLMAFLASDEASHINGSQITIDNGAMAR